METRNRRRKPAETANITKHAALTEALRELAATLAPGDRFPSQTELMRRYQVSDRTVLRSLEDLRRNGWIVRQHGVGTFVSRPLVETVVVAPPPKLRTLAALATSFVSYYKHCIDVLSVLAEGSDWSLVCRHARYPVQFEDALPLEAMDPQGFVLFSYSLHPVAEKLQERGHRVVIVGVPPVDAYPTVPCIYSDHDQGGYLATRHLLDLGHRRIAFAYSSPGSPQPLTERLRWRGHQRAIAEMRRTGVPISDSQIEREQFKAWSENPMLARDFFRATDAPTAIATWNDKDAAQLLGIFQQAGIRVPEQVSLIGYDNLPEFLVSYPTLTTVDPHVESQLRAALDLLTRPTPPPPTYTVVVPPTLRARSTCACPISDERTGSYATTAH